MRASAQGLLPQRFASARYRICIMLHLLQSATPVQTVEQATEPVTAGDIVAALRRRGMRITPQRQAIVAEVMRTRGHISPAETARRVQSQMPGVNPSTVYRTLAMLESAGILAHAHLEQGAEYHRAGEEGHVHLVCARCASEEDLSVQEARSLARLIGRHHGFRPDLTHFAISGFCRSCQEFLDS